MIISRNAIDTKKPEYMQVISWEDDRKILQMLSKPVIIILRTLRFMKKQIRRGVFETNSSSMHSIAICTRGELLDTLPVDKDGVVTLYGGEFGWGIESYRDAQTKASYCWEDNKENPKNLEMLINIIKEQTGCKHVVYLGSDKWEDPHWSYIDHQSMGTSHDLFFSEEFLKHFIFNPGSQLVIDNDNH